MINWLIYPICIHAFASSCFFFWFWFLHWIQNNCKRNMNIILHKFADWSMTTTELMKANFGFLNAYFLFNSAHSGVGSVNHQYHANHTQKTESIFWNHQKVGALKLFSAQFWQSFYYARSLFFSKLSSNEKMAVNKLQIQRKMNP